MTEALRRAADDANRELFELGKLINEAGAFPLSYTDSDRQVMAQHRFNVLRRSMAPLMPVRVVETGDAA